MDIKLICLVFFGAGLIVGWNFFPQPVVVKELVDKVIVWVKSLMGK